MQVEAGVSEESCNPEKALCGCGRPIQYMVSANPEVLACNKYARCLTYDELVTKRMEMYSQLQEARKYCTKLLDLQALAGRGFTGNHEFGEAADWRELWRFIQTLPQ